MALAADAAVLWYAQGADPSDPNGYLAFAKNAINHIEDLWNDSPVCNESLNSCGRNNTNDFDDVDFFAHVWQLYSLVHGQLSGAEITAVVGKVLNDNDSSHNGLNASACTKQTFSPGNGSITINTGTNVVTGVGTTFTSTVSPGQILFTGGSSVEIGVVYSITSDTSLILTTHGMTTDTSDSSWQFVAPWSTGDCGMIWLEKHAGFAPVGLIPSQASHYSTDYPYGGTLQTVAPIDQNLVVSAMRGYINVGEALADDDARATTLWQQTYDYFYSACYPNLKSGWDGFNQGAWSYGPGVWYGVTELVLTVRNSTVSGPDLTGGLWISRTVPYTYMTALPATPMTSDSWVDIYSTTLPVEDMRGPLEACYIASGPTAALSTECQYLYNYFRNVRTDYNTTSSGWAFNSGSYLPEFYIFYNYTASSSAPNQTQYVFKDSDLTYTQCSTSFGSSNCVNGQIWSNGVSKSDWTSTASQLFMKAGWYKQGQDHTDSAMQGDFHIFRNVYLMAGDDAANDGDAYLSSSQVFTGSMIDLNQSTCVGCYAPFLRWAGTDPTGDASSRYAYALVDLSNAFYSGGNAKRVNRHFIHFKKSGSQDYVVTYDDILISSALAVAPKAYMQYALNGASPGAAITYSKSGKTISNLQTSAGVLLNSAFISTAGSTTSALVIDNANGTYTGGRGYTYRAYMCPSADGLTCNASATSGEWIGVFEPINGTSGSMPTLTQLTAANFRVVQISDSTTPKVAAFAEGGSSDPPNTYTSASFTTTHLGTGQYLIAGLTAGTYSATVNGTAVSGSPFTVNAGDNTLYFESTSGAVTVTQVGSAGSSGPTLSCDLNGDGVVNVQDVQISLNAALGTTSCLPQYQLDGSGACNIIDVQRVVAAALGMGCRIGS